MGVNYVSKIVNKHIIIIVVVVGCPCSYFSSNISIARAPDGAEANCVTCWKVIYNLKATKNIKRGAPKLPIFGWF